MKMNKKTVKKIIISSYDDLKNPVYSGGGAYSVHQLAMRLQEKYEVTVLTGTYKKAKNEKIDKVQYIRLGSDIFGHKIGQLIYQYSLVKYALKNNFDLWIESSTPPFTFSLLPLFSKKPVVAWIHMLCSSDMQRKYKINIRFLEQELCKLYRLIITPTEWVKNEIKSMNKNAEITIIHPGFDPFIKNNQTEHEIFVDRYLLYLGRIEINQKGLDLLLQAMPYTLINTKLIIAGNGTPKEENKLNKLIYKYGLIKKVKRVGRVSGEYKYNLIKNAKAVIIPSRFETFSLTALEAIMHQKPVICFDIPQLKWIPSKYALKIEPFRLPDLARGIDNIFTSRIKKQINNKDKKEYLEKFDWNNITAQFESHISQINI